MGTILQERVVARCLGRFSIRERESDKAPWSNNNHGPNVASEKMGRRQSQRKSLQTQNTFPSQDCAHAAEKRLQQRRRHKPNSPSTKHNTSQLSTQGTSDLKVHPVSSAAVDRKEPTVHQSTQRGHHRDRKHTGSRRSRPGSAVPRNHLSDSSPDLIGSQTSNQEGVNLSGHGEGDSDRDLSELERLPVPPSPRVPPQLDLRPEVINPNDVTSHSHWPRGQNHSAFHFPDFLPPPFNSWSLIQLAMFYNMEGRGAPRPRPVSPLDRYLERLLQLEWHQVQTVQEESGRSSVSDVLASCHRSHTTASSRLSCPKSILQCQRAFPLTFLSSLASHSALLSGCTCARCRLRYSTCGHTCCRSSYGHTHQSRVSPLLERRGPVSLPKRSYSESRVHSSDKSLASRAQRFSSPVRGNSHHLKRMQALGNIRNPVQGATGKPHSTARDSSVDAGRDCSGAVNVWSGDRRLVGLRRRSGSEQRWSGSEQGRSGSEQRRSGSEQRRGGAGQRRSGSEQRRGGAERRRHVSEGKRSGSECRRGGDERRRAAGPREQEIKPDAVTAIMDNLPSSKQSPLDKPSRLKQVEFVT